MFHSACFIIWNTEEKKKIRTRETHITNQTHNNNNNNKNREWMHNWRAEKLAHSFDM